MSSNSGPRHLVPRRDDQGSMPRTESHSGSLWRPFYLLESYLDDPRVIADMEAVERENSAARRL